MHIVAEIRLTGGAFAPGDGPGVAPGSDLRVLEKIHAVIEHEAVAEGDSVRKVTVITGYADDDFIEITAGLTAGEKVVTIGQGGLRQGSKIKDLAEAGGEDDGKGQADATGERQDYADAQDK